MFFERLEPYEKADIKVAVFDFDGTISTLRHGWEQVMEPLMIECICGDKPIPRIEKEVKEYIDSSTGIQTILQMTWLCNKVQEENINKNMPKDPWKYKEEYNRRLLKMISDRKLEAADNSKKYLIKGAEDFLAFLCNKNVKVYAASGTDDLDVKAEAEILKVNKYFTSINGAGEHSTDCSKAAVIERLLNQSNIQANQILVVGDGPVEIELGRKYNTLTLGIVGDEEKREGVSPCKKERLIKAGAHALTDCFDSPEKLWSLMVN